MGLRQAAAVQRQEEGEESSEKMLLHRGEELEEHQRPYVKANRGLFA